MPLGKERVWSVFVNWESQRGSLCVNVPIRTQYTLHTVPVSESSQSTSSSFCFHKTMASSSNAIREEYMSSLADLDQNSKPMIDMLTMLAEDHRQHAPIIVDCIKQRIAQV